MLSLDTVDRLIKILVPEGVDSVPIIEAKYKYRSEPTGSEVLRIAPSPTGFVHIGTVYASLLNERLAHQSGGKFLLRIEDTDKKREVEGSIEMIVDALKKFGIIYDEGPDIGGDYGPYYQSERRSIYLAYAVELLRVGRAYPCFASSEELQANTKLQQAQKVRPGYYGQWAIWRNKTDQDINQALDDARPFVLRFRSEGNHSKRISFVDVLKGKLEVPENDLDVPLIKSDDSRLPTYHLAHVVDDYLMQVTKIFRSDEWLPSTALHIDLSQALGHQAFTYGHFAPISIIDKNTGGKRKLSKRKDDEADVRHWLDLGYPVEAIKAYLIGLANSNFEDWYREHPDGPVSDFPLSLKKLSASRSPLLDVTKLENYARDYIARLSYDEFYNSITDHASESFREALLTDADYTKRVLMIERDGNKPRKDMTHFGQAFDQYGYFFDDIFADNFRDEGRQEFLSDFDDEMIATATNNFSDSYDYTDDQAIWFDKLKLVADKSGFAADNKAYKLDPDSYKGNTADFARIIRVRLTGKSRTPDLWAIMQVMGADRVAERLKTRY